jgi:glutamate synthase (NADPH/NADH) large chain
MPTRCGWVPVRNVNRRSALLGSESPADTAAPGCRRRVHIRLNGSAGGRSALHRTGHRSSWWRRQRLCRQGPSGGRIIVKPPDDVLFLPEDHVVAGNTLLYGATSGEVFLVAEWGSASALETPVRSLSPRVSATTPAST